MELRPCVAPVDNSVQDMAHPTQGRLAPSLNSLWILASLTLNNMPYSALHETQLSPVHFLPQPKSPGAFLQRNVLGICVLHCSPSLWPSLWGLGCDIQESFMGPLFLQALQLQLE